MNFEGHSTIVGIGAFLPKTRVKSEDLMHEIGSTRFGIPERFISKRIGIKERRISDAKTLPSDMAVMASEVALKDAGVRPMDIDMVLYCGIERDWQKLATAHRVQLELGASRAVCLDVTNACHGFMSGLSIADAYIASGAVNQVLVCTGEKPSNVMYEFIREMQTNSSKKDFKRWLGSLTVGDAGGAMVVKKKSGSNGWRRFRFHSAGQHAELCYYRHTKKSMEGQMIMGKMGGLLVKTHKNMINETYCELKWLPSDIDKLYCHQVGSLPHMRLTQVVGVSSAKAPVTYEHYGNLTSATIPVSMVLSPPKRGDKLLVLGAGSGVSACQAGMTF